MQKSVEGHGNLTGDIQKVLEKVGFLVMTKTAELYFMLMFGPNWPFVFLSK